MHHRFKHGDALSSSGHQLTRIRRKERSEEAKNPKARSRRGDEVVRGTLQPTPENGNEKSESSQNIKQCDHIADTPPLNQSISKPRKQDHAYLSDRDLMYLSFERLGRGLEWQLNALR